MISQPNYKRLQEFYAGSFDHKRQDKKLKQSYIGGLNFKACEKHYGNRIPTRSPRDRKRNSGFELNWDQRFEVSPSKDNQKFHKLLRFYFTTQTPMVLKKQRAKSPRVHKRVIRKQWRPVFNPISEINLAKHTSNRFYFDNSI